MSLPWRLGLRTWWWPAPSLNNYHKQLHGHARQWNQHQRNLFVEISGAEVRGWQQMAEGRNVHLLTKTIIAAQNITGVVLVLNIVPDKAQEISNQPRTRYATTGNAVLTTSQLRARQQFVQQILHFRVALIGDFVESHLNIVRARILERSQSSPRKHVEMDFATSLTGLKMAE